MVHKMRFSKVSLEDVNVDMLRKERDLHVDLERQGSSSGDEKCSEQHIVLTGFRISQVILFKIRFILGNGCVFF